MEYLRPVGAGGRRTGGLALKVGPDASGLVEGGALCLIQVHYVFHIRTSLASMATS